MHGWLGSMVTMARPGLGGKPSLDLCILTGGLARHWIAATRRLPETTVSPVRASAKYPQV